MLDLAKKLINSLAEQGVRYCSWKNNQDLEAALAGDGDVDLLVSLESRDVFNRILAELGFIEASRPMFSFPFVQHYYGFDASSGKLLHLHVYFRIVTGESHIKNFHFPLEGLLIDACESNDIGVRVPPADWQFLLFLLRHYIKISCVPGALLYFRERDSYRREFEQIDRSAIEQLPGALLSDELLSEMIGTLEKGLGAQLVLGLRLRLELSHLSRYGFMRAFYERYKQIIYRVINKLVLKRRKQVAVGGRLIAITGLDGSGKSTSVESMVRWLGKEFDCKTVHAGRPSASLLTFPLRAVLMARRVLLRNKRKEDTMDDVVSRDKARGVGLLAALRYAALGYERYRCLAKAQKKVMQGYIVICDRYPSLTQGKMDSPRISVDQNANRWIRFLARLEKRFYERLPKPDLLLKMRVPVEEAVARNRLRVKVDKETDDEIRARYAINQDLEYSACRLVDVDAAIPLDEMLLKLKQYIWKSL